jgi:hypothetical protein
LLPEVVGRPLQQDRPPADPTGKAGSGGHGPGLRHGLPRSEVFCPQAACAKKRIFPAQSMPILLSTPFAEKISFHPSG